MPIVCPFEGIIERCQVVPGEPFAALSSLRIDADRKRWINGVSAAIERVRSFERGVSHLDVEELAAVYMKTGLGGYALFYAASLEDARLVRPGATGLVDRVTEHGAAVAEAFAERFEETTYARDYLQDPKPIPVEVLRELGEAACLCTIPGRTDHQLLLDTFFGEPLSAPDWEERRRRRIQSLVLRLEFHDQRPSGADDIPLIIQDKKLGDDGSLDFSKGIISPTGLLGDQIIVNGTRDPHLEVSSERVACGC